VAWFQVPFRLPPHAGISTRASKNISGRKFLKFELTKTKLLLLGTSGVLAMGIAGVGIAAHAASPAPSASAAAVTPKAAEIPEPAESPATAGTTAAETPEAPGAAETDAAGGHADAPGDATADHQFDGQE